jgi:hypothetical protein
MDDEREVLLLDDLLNDLKAGMRLAEQMFEKHSEVPGNETALQALVAVSTFIKGLRRNGIEIESKAIDALIYDIQGLNQGHPSTFINRTTRPQGGSSPLALHSVGLQARAAAAVECLFRDGDKPLDQCCGIVARHMNAAKLVSTKMYDNSWEIRSATVKNWRAKALSCGSDDPLKRQFEMMISAAADAGLSGAAAARCIARCATPYDKVRRQSVEQEGDFSEI